MALLEVERIDPVYCSNEVPGLQFNWPGLSPPRMWCSSTTYRRERRLEPFYQL